MSDTRRVSETETRPGTPATDQQTEAIVMTSRGVAHEINSLMATVMGSAALVRGSLPEGHPAFTIMDTIEEAASKTGDLCRRILWVTDEAHPRVQAIRVNGIVNHLLIAEEQSLAPRIRITRYVDADLWDVQADLTRLAQALLNLAHNAIDSIPGTGRVTIRTRNTEIEEGSAWLAPGMAPGRYICVSIEDTGTGIPPEALGRVFDPDFSTKGPGHGQGLAFVREVVRESMGHIVATSDVGCGSEFRLYLPAVMSSRRQPAPKRSEMPRGTETILIVEDEALLLAATQKLLERLGYRTLTARNGQEAVELCRDAQTRIHLALLDLVMPGMGGVEAYPLLKRERPDLRVIVVTGLGEDLRSQSLLQAGADAFLFKPYQPSLLAWEIRRILDQAAVQNQ